MRQICSLLEISYCFELIEELFSLVNGRPSEFLKSAEKMNFRKVEARLVVLIINLLKNIQLINALA